METVEELKEALCEVRKAHRMVYSYQQRMMDLMLFIKSKLNMDTRLMARKWFSNRIGKETFHLYPEMWAWDFVYSYVVEYDFGEGTTADGYNYSLSIIQYADTGFFDRVGNSKTVLESFETEDDSVSKLLFYLEVKPKSKRNWLWNVQEIVDDKTLAGKNHTSSVREIDSVKQVFYSVPIEQFLDEASTISALQDFLSYCKKSVHLSLDLL